MFYDIWSVLLDFLLIFSGAGICGFGVLNFFERETRWQGVVLLCISWLLVVGGICLNLP